MAFNEKYNEFQQNNCDVWIVSVDSEYTIYQWTKTKKYEGGILGNKIPYVSDLNKDISIDFGALMADGCHSDRTLVIVDNKGIIRSITRNDPPAGRNPDEVLRVLKAYQHADQHGVVCPANFHANNKTVDLVDTPHGKLQYFQSKYNPNE